MTHSTQLGLHVDEILDNNPSVCIDLRSQLVHTPRVLGLLPFFTWLHWQKLQHSLANPASYAGYTVGGELHHRQNWTLVDSISSSETQGQIVGARERLNARKQMARRKVKNGEKSYFSSRHFFSARLVFPLPPLSAPGSPRMIPSAKRQQNPCSGSPHVYQDLSMCHDWPVENAMVKFANWDDRKFKTHFW